MPKEQYRESNFGKRISHVTFQVDSSSEIQQAAHIQVITKNLYAQDGQRVPAPNGVLDRRMGTNQKDAKCETCGLGLAECVGHFGYIDLALPVFHVGYFRSTIIILQTICKSCAKVLLPKDLKRSFLRKFLKPDLSYLHMKSLRAAVHKKAKSQSKCPSCGAYNGIVKKGPAGILKIVHEVYRGKKPTDPAVQRAIREYNVAVESNTELKAMLNSGLIKELSPVEVLELFSRIPDSEIPLLGMRVRAGRPVDLILQRLPVPPICIRPSVVSDVKAGTNEDDLTVKQSEIMLINDVIARHIASGGKTELVQEDWDYLQLHAALYINSEMSGIPLNMQPKKPGRGLVQRLKGKQGRFRGNLSGKRVDFSSRTVISPDPNLQIQEVGVPVHVAKVLTYPERVFPANIEWLRRLVRAGPDRHPGANYVQLRAGDAKRYLKYGNREKIAQELKYGDLVERHLVDGDVVLFNRQPSLHKLSIMSHRAKVQPQRTFRFNECVCTPYNADFDGDEMNLHLPQTEEARAEALILMGNKSNLVTPRNGELLIAATQDFITGGYLLTQRDRFLTHAQAARLALALCAGADAGMPLRLPPPAILKPDRLWTGKQIISLIMRPNARCEVKLNLEAAGRVYRDLGRDKYIAPDDTYVVIRNSEVVCGALDKSTLGSGNKTSLFYALLRDWGEDCAVKAMWRLGRMSSEFLTMLGFSIGIGDVTPTASLLDDRRKLFASGFAKCDAFMEKAAKGTLEVQMGCTVDQTLEAVMTSELNAVRNAAAASCYRNLRGGNAPLIMAKCGSKGSNDNVAQMIVCLGQQAISGKRMPNGFEQRALPLFKRESKEPATRGFVQNSFYSGLTPAEFYFHTMCGREGLVDTAVKTADTGYLQRRLVKALEDLVLHYDMTVRNATGDVVQFQYGCDGLDPACMEGQGRPVDLPRALADVCARYPHRDEEPLDGVGIEIAAKETLATSDFNTCPEEFKREMLSFLGDVSQRVRAVRARYAGSGAVGKEPERLTLSQLVRFLRAAHDKYQCSTIEPGTAVGALAAQSIGEPGTQMTLKTFHFAGVASMNITQGVPRVKEIINAARAIATPVVTAELRDSADLENAERVKNRLVRTTLGDVMINMSIYHTPGESYVLVNLDMKYIERMKLEINEETIVYSILTSKMRLRPEQVSVMSAGRVKVTCDLSKNSGWANVTALQMARQLPAVLVAGLAHVARAVVTCGQPGRYKLIVEGDGLRDVMATYGVDPNRTTSNNILEVYQTLGIEAAKSTIISEIQAVMAGHGMCVDRRHVELLAGQMTARGEVLGITRYGLAKMKESVLNLASFEKTADHLFDAAYYGQRDSIEGVSESIILGVPARIGTGLLHLLHDHRRSEPLARRRPVFDQPQLHDALWE